MGKMPKRWYNTNLAEKDGLMGVFALLFSKRVHDVRFGAEKTLRAD
jgi:hypothetical protein